MALDSPARRITARLAVPRPRRDLTGRRGTGEITSDPVPEDEDIWVRERIRTRRSVILLVDVPGSMRGERVRTGLTNVAFPLQVARRELARDLARLGRGRRRPIHTYKDVAPALSEVFSG